MVVCWHALLLFSEFIDVLLLVFLVILLINVITAIGSYSPAFLKLIIAENVTKDKGKYWA